MGHRTPQRRKRTLLQGLLMIAALLPLPAFGADALHLLERFSREPLVREAEQALVVLGRAPADSAARAVLCERRGGIWTARSPELPAVAGKKGFASVGAKREGDGKTPSGVFGLIASFGYASSCETKLPYRTSTAEDFWVDDPASPRYNTWVHGKKPAESAEKMRRSDGLYRWGVVVAYNLDPVVPGEGSAIFLHVWRDPASGTAGCVALSEENLRMLLAWLDPGKKPVVIMGVPEEIMKR